MSPDGQRRVEGAMMGDGTTLWAVVSLLGHQSGVSMEWGGAVTAFLGVGGEGKECFLNAGC